MDINYDRLPSHMQDSARRYMEHGHPVGDFLTFVMENDLCHAFVKADDINTMAMREWAAFLYNAPGKSWGSPEKVREWQAHNGLAGPDNNK